MDIIHYLSQWIKWRLSQYITQSFFGLSWSFGNTSHCIRDFGGPWFNRLETGNCCCVALPHNMSWGPPSGRLNVLCKPQNYIQRKVTFWNTVSWCNHTETHQCPWTTEHFTAVELIIYHLKRCHLLGPNSFPELFLKVIHVFLWNNKVTNIKKMLSNGYFIHSVLLFITHFLGSFKSLHFLKQGTNKLCRFRLKYRK